METGWEGPRPNEDIEKVPTTFHPYPVWASSLLPVLAFAVAPILSFTDEQLFYDQRQERRLELCAIAPRLLRAPH